MVEYKPESIISRLRQTVSKGKYGKDYTIVRRDKNNLLREKYLVDDNKVKAILLDIDTADYVKSEPSDNEYFLNDIVHIFRSDVQLIRRYSEEIETANIILYIKFTWCSSQNGQMIIISFHEENDI